LKVRSSPKNIRALVDAVSDPDKGGVSLTSASDELGAEEFRKCQKAARRSGNPAWLWPEVSVDSWSAAAARVSDAASAILRGDTAALVVDEPLALSLACFTSGMGPLLGWWLERGMLTAAAETGAVLALHLQHSRERAKRVEAQARTIVALLAQTAVPVVVLKGGHTAHAYFPEPATRPASDLDILVPPASATAAEETLASRGLRCASRQRLESSWIDPQSRREPRSLWLVHADSPWSVDLHSSLNFSAGPGAPVVRLDSADPFASQERWAVDPAAHALAQPLQLLHLAVHASGGLHSLTLLRIVEIILVVRSDSENRRLSWDEFVEMAERTNGLGAAYPALAMCNMLAPGTIPDWVLSVSSRSAGSRVRGIVSKLQPATAQRVHRASIAEHFMWAAGVSGWMRQLYSDLAPTGSGHSTRSIYEARLYRLLRGKFSR
jgi:hypothetical protein